jgi:hypothetical protein
MVQAALEEATWMMNFATAGSDDGRWDSGIRDGLAEQYERAGLPEASRFVKLR